MVTLAELQVRTLGPTTVPSPLAQYVGGRATNEYYVGEDDRILFDDTIDDGAAITPAPTTLPPPANSAITASRCCSYSSRLTTPQHVQE